jgi:uncharacterized membrane protein YdbT with pleckstrin-like domain
LLREDRDEAPVERVQDVQIVQEGFLANVLGFGNVIIQSAAATGRVIFADVPNPEHVQDVLFSPMYQARTKERAEIRETIRRELGHRLNISGSILSDQEPEKGEPFVPSGEKETGLEAEDDLSGLSRWLLAGWQWFRGLFSFDTWIYSDEGSTITWRKTGWLLVRASLMPFFLGFLVVAPSLWVISQGVGLPLLPILLLLALLVIFGWWFYLYWDWQNDIYEIRDNRLIDLKRRPLFLQELRRETTLDKIQNISLSVPGPVAQLLRYGTVVIETAGELGAFTFEFVHDPRGVQAEIFDRWEEVNRKQREGEMLKRHSEMAEWFEIYEELKQRQG